MGRGSQRKRTWSSCLRTFAFLVVHIPSLWEGILNHLFRNTQACVDSHVRHAPKRAFASCRILVSNAFGSSNDLCRTERLQLASTSTRVLWRMQVTALCFRFVPSPLVFRRCSNGSQGVQHGRTATRKRMQGGRVALVFRRDHACMSGILRVVDAKHVRTAVSSEPSCPPNPQSFFST